MFGGRSGWVTQAVSVSVSHSVDSLGDVLSRLLSAVVSGLLNSLVSAAVSGLLSGTLSFVSAGRVSVGEVSFRPPLPPRPLPLPGFVMRRTVCRSLSRVALLSSLLLSPSVLAAALSSGFGRLSAVCGIVAAALVRRTDALVSRRLTALVSVFSVLRCISVACVLSAALLLSATAVLLAAVRLPAIRSFVSFAAPVVNTGDISCVDSVLSLSVSRICVG